jgi:hypothetical protein
MTLFLASKVLDLQPELFRQPLGHDLAVAAAGVGLVAEQGGLAVTGDLGGAGHLHLGGGLFEVLLEDPPHLLDATGAGGVAPGLGRAEIAQVAYSIPASARLAASSDLEKPARREAATARTSISTLTSASFSFWITAPWVSLS